MTTIAGKRPCCSLVVHFSDGQWLSQSLSNKDRTVQTTRQPDILCVSGPPTRMHDRHSTRPL